MSIETGQDLDAQGEANYQQWRDRILSDPERRAHEEDLARKELWLQLVEAWQAASISEAE